MPPSSTIALRGSARGALGASGSSYSLGTTTQAGDLIVIIFDSGTSNWGTSSAAVSGAGATWDKYLWNSSAQGAGQQGFGVFIGYNASAGATSVTLTNNPNSTGQYTAAVFSGCATSDVGTVATNFIYFSSGTGGYSLAGVQAGSLILGLNNCYSFGTTSGSWNPTQASTLLNLANTGTRQTVMDAAIAASSGTQGYFTPLATTNGIASMEISIPQAVIAAAGAGAGTFASTAAATVVWPGSGSTAANFGAPGSAVLVWAATGSTAADFEAPGSATFDGFATGSTTASFTGSGSASQFSPASGSGSATFSGSGSAVVVWTGSGSTAAAFSSSGSALVKWPATGHTSVAFTSTGSASVRWAATGLTGVAFNSTGSANYRLPATGSTSAAFVGSAQASVDYFVSGATYVAFYATGAGSVRYSHPGTVRGGVAISSVAGGYETAIVGGSFAAPGLAADIEVLNGHYLL